MVALGTVTSLPVLAVHTCTAWPQPAMVQSPRVSFSIMPQEVMPLVQSAVGGGAGRPVVRYLPSFRVRLSVLMALRPSFRGPHGVIVAPWGGSFVFE